MERRYERRGKQRRVEDVERDGQTDRNPEVCKRAEGLKIDKYIDRDVYMYRLKKM